MLLGEDLLAKADAGGRTRPARSQLSSRRLSIGPAMSATMAIKLIERNAHVCFKLITRTTITWKASESESKKQYGNQLFHFLLPSSRRKHPRLLQLSILPNQALNFFLHIHIVGRGELPLVGEQAFTSNSMKAP
jgi:hypothetical protein